MKPGLYVPIELARAMAALLGAAKCPNAHCVDGVVSRGYQNEFEHFECEWCSERKRVLASMK